MTAVTQEGPIYARGGFRRLARGLLLALAVLLLIPYLLAPLYRFVDPVSTPMLARWLTGRKVVHISRPIGAMAPSLPLSVLAAEDDRFCSHHGVDWDAIAAAVRKAGDIGNARGSSTITQQVAKNLFLWEGRSFVRKALELPLALWIDLTLPKRRIMEIYLNIAEWGPQGEFGAEAGARAAFGKSAADLSPHESALLAAILPNPKMRNARRPGLGVRRLAGIYEARAHSAAGSAGCLALRATRH
ncbi:MAG TPA: transglycosylase domain-containing protein [Xanthobacteraceae bacterium]|jgi:monofunctional biosynthetic peptidoglycan transglycosylase|nr:transglycosylase domain-containing protein [Xanthobacteraceae bacterium]